METVGTQDSLVATLRDLFRNLHYWDAAYKDHGIEIVTDPNGVEWHILDLHRLRGATVRLPPRQRQAIEMFLIGGQTETDVAIAMGIKPNNPVGQYATRGLVALIEMARCGQISGFVVEDRWGR